MNYVMSPDILVLNCLLRKIMLSTHTMNQQLTVILLVIQVAV